MAERKINGNFSRSVIIFLDRVFTEEYSSFSWNIAECNESDCYVKISNYHNSKTLTLHFHLDNGQVFLDYEEQLHELSIELIWRALFFESIFN